MEHCTLLKLVAMARADDKEAFEELLARFRPMIRSFSRGLPATDRQDLEQELSIQLSRLIQGYQIDEHEPPRDRDGFEREGGGRNDA